MSFSSRSSLTSVGWRVWEANPVLCPIRLDRRRGPALLMGLRLRHAAMCRNLLTQHHVLGDPQ